jgi:SAM-dependent methyltransferase
MISLYKSHIEASIKNAHEGSSKCTHDILELDGMSGNMTRHLYNNLCSFQKPDKTPISYLEVGAWKGSSTISALYKNNCKATIIDNWSEFEDPRKEFAENVSKYLDNQIQLIEEDSFNLKTIPMHAPYDIYLYDGGHKVEEHEKAIVDFWHLLADTAIILIDDWDWESVKEGTNLGFKKVNANVVYTTEIASNQPCFARYQFWNGCGIFIITK